jgi:hypothetical protein
MRYLLLYILLALGMVYFVLIYDDEVKITTTKEKRVQEGRDEEKIKFVALLKGYDYALLTIPATNQHPVNYLAIIEPAGQKGTQALEGLLPFWMVRAESKEKAVELILEIFKHSPNVTPRGYYDITHPPDCCAKLETR